MTRFRVTSVTGYPIGSDATAVNAEETTLYQVLDSAYCYRLMFETGHRDEAEHAAEALNAGDFDWIGNARAKAA